MRLVAFAVTFSSLLAPGFGHADAKSETCAFVLEGARNSVAAYRDGVRVSSFALFAYYHDQGCDLAAVPSDEREFAKIAVVARDQLLKELASRDEDIDRARMDLASFRKYFDSQSSYDEAVLRYLPMVSQRRTQRLARINSIEGCQPEDFRDRLPRAWDQGGAPWCYAEEAATLASFIAGEPVSVGDTVATFLHPSWIAKGNRRVALAKYDTPMIKTSLRMEARDVIGRSILDAKVAGGEIQEALEALTESGACSEANWRNEIIDPKSGKNVWYELMSDLERDAARMTHENDARAWARYQRLFPKVSMADFERIALNSKAEDLIRNLGGFACRERLALRPMAYQTRSVVEFRPLELTRLLQKQINLHHPVPVAILAHAMMVAGQYRAADGQCRFIVRNSWGQTCGNLEKSFPNAVPGSCNRGYFEIEAAKFSEGPFDGLQSFVTYTSK